MTAKISLSIVDLYLDLPSREGHEVTLAICEQDVRMWCMKCDACSAGYAFEPGARSVWTLDGKTVRDMPHLDEIFKAVADQQAANQHNPIGAHLEPFAHALEVAVSARDGSSVYFVEAEGRIKIGWSKRVATRMAALQTGNATPIRLLGTIPGARSVERRLHDRFAHLRLSGEWFNGAPELREYVAAVAQ